MDVATGSMASLLPKLDKLLEEENNLPKSAAKDIKYLSKEMKSMHATLLEMAGENQLSPQMKIWAADARELSYNLEVVVDRLLVYAPHSEGLMEKMGSLLKKGKTRYRIITDAIKDIKDQVREVSERYHRYMVSDSVPDSMMIDPRLWELYEKKPDLVGTDGKAYQELMKLVSDGENMQNKKLKRVSVVGFGGLGKTTLVYEVYKKIKRDFDCKCFVPVGRNADVKKVFKDILFDLNCSRVEDDTVDERQLVENLWEIIENKRYLIVIDDIWDENLWGSMEYAFSKENNLGSRIITTTRIVSVAKACCSSGNDSIYQMEPLSDDDSKKLLYMAMLSHDSGCPHEFEQASIDILKRCGGVPLAILAVASYLGRAPLLKVQDEWHAWLKSIYDMVAEDTRWGNMRSILSLSYYDLPPHLRTCLLYLCTFHESHAIERDRLVKKWIAEGIVTQESNLIGSSNKKEAKLSQELSLEEAASQYLEELVNRNVIQPLECNNDCEVVTYHIHPFMHTVLKSLAIEANFAACFDAKYIFWAPYRVNVKFPHLSVDCPDPIYASSMAFPGVRSLTVFGHANRFLLRPFAGIRHLDLEGCKGIDRVDLEYICCMVLLKQLCLAKTQITHLPPQIGNLQHLEGLDVGGTQIAELPTQIGKLKHLEILDVGGTQITELPPQISKLQNLKKLDARKSQVKDIPDQVVQLTRLVHLLIGDNESGEGVKLPDGIGKMTSLQQLGTIDLRKCSASSLMELGKLPYLEEIAAVSSDESADTRVNNVLVSFTNLRSLVVYSDFKLSTRLQTFKYLNFRKKLTVERSLKVPIGFAGQRFLRFLDIRVCSLEKDDLKILGELSMLQSLIVRLEVLPRKMLHINCEGFVKLESFHYDCRMPRVIFEEGAMPKLGDLELKLYAGSASEKHMGIKHLLNLQEVCLRYSKWYAENKGVKETIEAVKTEDKEHQNRITLCIAEENKDGTCTMETEIFPENKDAGASRMTEAEEEDEHAEGTGDDTQEGGLRQRNFGTASNSGINEIEEVVE